MGPDIHEPVAGVRVRAFAEASGKIKDCVVISRFGRPESATALCNAFEGKKVKPARDVDGEPISGFVETIIWVTPNAHTRVSELPDLPPDAQLTVSRLPEDQPGPFRLTVGLIIDETGSIAACGPIKADHEAMAVAACGTLEGEAFPLVEGRDGIAIRYARSFDVEFSTGVGTSEGA